MQHVKYTDPNKMQVFSDQL